MLIGSIAGTFVSFGIWICAGIYTIAAKIFQVFMLLAGNNVIDSSVYESLLNNVYLIIGVVMLFIIAFYLLQMMVNPDDSNKSRSSITKLIMNFITSLLIIILLPTIFGFLYDVQASIINNNTIGKFFNYDTDAEASETVNQAGARIANSIWLAFFNVNEEWCESVKNIDVSTSAGIAECQAEVVSQQEIFSWNRITFSEAIDQANNKINFYIYMRFAENTQDAESITFHFIFCLVAGLALAYVGISYCLDMGVRYVKLIFYQVIAPIPILLRMVPGGKMSESFNQWVKITLTCYFEVFVRILVLYFCVWICDVIIDGGLFTNATSSGWFVTTLAQACILMGIVAFMQQAPKLIGQMLGIDSGNMKLGIRDKLKEGGGLIAGAVIGGGVTAGVRNFTNPKNWRDKEGNLDIMGGIGRGFKSSVAGVVSGGVRSGIAGRGAGNFKDMKAAASSGSRGATDAKAKRANYRAAHGNTFRGAMAGHVSDMGGSVRNWATDSSIEGLQKESQQLGALASSYSNYKDSIEGLLESEIAKGEGSIFVTDDSINEGIRDMALAYSDRSKEYKQVLAAFNATGGVKVHHEAKYAEDGTLISDAYDEGATQEDLDNAIRNMESAKDNFRDNFDLMYGNGDKKGKHNEDLSSKARGAFADIRVNGKSLETELLRNASSSTVRDTSAKAIDKIYKGEGFTFNDLKTDIGNVKDVAKDRKSNVDMQIATKQAENAAKGDDKK